MALSFFGPDFESDRLSVLAPAEGCGVERPDAFPSGALPFCAGAAASFSFTLELTAPFAAGFSVGLGAGLVERFTVPVVGGAD